MTDPSTIQYLWKYMAFADSQMLVAAASVDEPGFYWEQGISLGSIHKLLVHAVAAQTIWLQRLQHQDPGRMLTAAELPDLAAIRERWPPLHEELRLFAEQQTSESLTRTLHGKNTRGQPFALPVGATMLHVCDHATYHRGQLNSMIKLAGGKPSPVMLYTFAKNASQ